MMSNSKVRNVLLWGVPGLVLIGVALYWRFGDNVVSTDNAYAKADLIAIYPEVEAPVREVLVTENARVEQGQRLVTLDTEAAHIELDRAKAEVERIREEIAALRTQRRVAQAELELARERQTFAVRELDRQRELVARKLSPAIRLEEAEHLVTQADGQIEVLKQRIAELLVRLGPAATGQIDTHSAVQAAKTVVQAGELKLRRSVITAPVAGRVARLPEIGTMGRRSAPLLTLVRDDDIWIEANFKETQIEHLQPGQTVTVRFDSRPGTLLRGHIDTIAPASGAEFALLPPQNASGNWVKVVQRIPVRIVIDDARPKDAILVGMSAAVEVHLPD
ncbi:MAG: HlyD family secretion protein [Steroidobacteraceae bacterium]